MDKRRMHGFLDPITLGFILSIAGSAAVLSLDTPRSSDQIEQQVASDSLEVSRKGHVNKSSHEQPGS